MGSLQRGARLLSRAGALRPEEIRRDAHTTARGVFVDIETKDGAVGEFRTPVTPREPVRSSPTDGEHTAEILREAGFGDAELAALRASRAVK